MRISFRAANANLLPSADAARSFFLIPFSADKDLDCVERRAGTLLQR